MQGSHRYRSQGLSLIGLLVVLLVLTCLAVPAMKVAPTLIEYRAIVNAINSIKASGGTAQSMRAAFNRGAVVDEITSIAGADLAIESGTGAALEVSFAYDKKIPLYGPVSLLLNYTGSTAKTPARTE